MNPYNIVRRSTKSSPARSVGRPAGGVLTDRKASAMKNCQQSTTVPIPVSKTLWASCLRALEAGGKTDHESDSERSEVSDGCFASACRKLAVAGGSGESVWKNPSDDNPENIFVPLECWDQVLRALRVGGALHQSTDELFRYAFAQACRDLWVLLSEMGLNPDKVTRART